MLGAAGGLCHPCRSCRVGHRRGGGPDRQRAPGGVLSVRRSTFRPMRLLHTSDWHIGQSLHGADLLADQEAVLGGLADVVTDESVDVVLVAGDVYDRAVPSADAQAVLDRVVARLLDAGAPAGRLAGRAPRAPRPGPPRPRPPARRLLRSARRRRAARAYRRPPARRAAAAP